MHRLPFHILLFAGLALSASGATLTLTCMATPMPALTPGSQVSTGTLTCPQFNPALGTLTAYNLRAEGVGPFAAESGWMTLENNTSSPIIGSGPISAVFVQFTYTGLPGHGPFVGSGLISLDGPFNIPAGGGTQTLTVNKFGSIAPITLSLGGQVTLTQSLPSYVGTGTFQAGISATFRDSLASLQFIRYPDYSLVPGGSIAVLYQYNEVPEPSAIALLASGLGLLAVARVTAK